MDLNIKDYPEIEDHSLVLNGVYFQETGSLIESQTLLSFMEIMD